MKMINKKAVYVQKKDIAILRKVWKLDDTVLPSSIFIKCIGEKSTIEDNGKDRLDFVMFENEDEIEFFKNIYWIYDYDKLKELNGEEIQNIYFKLRNKITKLDYAISKKLSNDDSKYAYIYMKRDILDHMMDELVELLKSEKRIRRAIKENETKQISKKY